MKLQSIALPKTPDKETKSLYYRIQPQDEDAQSCEQPYAEQGVFYVPAKTRISFDTYFNALSLEKWKEYTNIPNITVRVKYHGSASIKIMHMYLEEEELIRRMIFEEQVSSNSFSSWEYELTDLDSGMIYLELETDDEEFRIEGGGFHCGECESRQVDLAMVICTYNRKAYVERNIALLKESVFLGEFGEHIHLHIVDNAQNLGMPEEESVTVHPNRNAGGAGGFTRGMIEVMNSNNAYTHVLLMDDDVMLEPEAILRTYALLSLLKREYKDAFIGGSMFRLDKKSVLVESGATWNKGHLISLKKDMDVSDPVQLLLHDREEKAEYHAWWYCCMPVSVLRDDNLPVPLFIRGDDIEYGLRNMRNLIMINGIGLWHEPFENKYSSFLEYYTMRNLLVDNVLHYPDFSVIEFLRFFLRRSLRQILTYRYKEVSLSIRGIEDFLKGVDFFRNADPETLHQEICSQGYRFYEEAVDQFPDAEERCRNSLKQEESMGDRILRLLFLNGNLLPATGSAVVSVAQHRPVNYFRVKKVLNYDASKRAGFVTQKEIPAMFSSVFQVLACSMRCMRDFRRARTDFRQNARELMQKSFWLDYLLLETDDE